MLVFCPVCGGFLIVEGGASSNVFTCKTCSYQLPVVSAVSQKILARKMQLQALFKVKSRIYPKLKDIDDVLGGTSAWEVADITQGT